VVRRDRRAGAEAEARRSALVGGDRRQVRRLAANIGAGAPQGVSGSVQALVSGSLLSKLKSHINSTGGSYSAGS
jgi:hypothetical protein